MPRSAAAAEYQIVRPGLYFWQAYEPAVKTDCCCCAVETPEGLVFYDPMPLEAAALAELAHSRMPRAVVLTNANHERAAAWYAERFGIEIWAREALRDRLELPGERMRYFEDGEEVFGAHAIALQGFAPGETAFHVGEVLIVGDAIINIEPYGFAVLPEKYCDDAKLARLSLRRLPVEGIEVATFAHGLPLKTQTAGRLARLLHGET